jgi:hypothetical protein
VRVLRSLSLIVVGVGLGLGVSSAFRDSAPDKGSSTGYDDSTVAPGTPVESLPPFQQEVLRFAWASTCEIALDGVTHGSVGDIRKAFEVAHDDAALFEQGVVPPDVAMILDEAYEVLVMRPRGSTTDGAPTSTGLGRRIGDVCRAWSARIEAGG